MENYEYKQTLIKEKNAISSAAPWLIALYINPGAGTDLAGYEYIVADTETLDWLDADNNPVTFQMYPFTLSGLSLSASAKLPNVTVNLFNSATIAKIVEENNCFLGSDVTVFMLNKNALKDTSGSFQYNMENYPLQFQFTVTNGTIGQKITLTLGSANYLVNAIPAKQYFRDFCQYDFLGEFCWMKDVPNLPSDIACDKTYETCAKFKKAHEDSLPTPMKGLRYGGFPALDKGTIRYS